MILLGPFELDAAIGRGGMGEVWKGVHVEHQVRVAVKVITSERALRPHYLSAFKNEVRATAGLDHPSIVMVLDYGVIDEVAASTSEGRFVAGSPYLAMELLDGGSLKRQVAKLQWPELSLVFMRLLDALAHAHARGMVHRDIKPPNVLFDRTQRIMKLSDFGLAHALEPELSGEENLRLGGVGTPGYMAPEQIQKRWRDYGPWTDLYALGCLAYEMITGRPPFGKAAGQATLRAHLSAPVPPMIAKVEIPPGLEAWVERLLEKDPLKRFRRAADAAFALSKLGGVDERTLHQAMVVDPSGAGDDEPSIVTLGEAGEVSSAETIALEIQETDEVAAHTPPPRMRAMEPIAVPPFPDSWRPPPRRRASMRLFTAGIGLWGLRTIPFVDRDAERDAVWSVLGRVRQARRPEVVILEGAAGCGKTRLAEWIGERAHEVGAASMLRAVHAPERGPNDGIGPMVARHLRLTGLARTDVGRRLEVLFLSQGITRADEWMAMTDLVAPVRFTSPSEKHAVLARFLIRLARERPLVLWLDDVQWGLDALRFADVVLAQEELPVLLIMTVREEALAERPFEQEALRRLSTSPRATRIAVGPLPAEHRAVLVRELLGLEGELASRVEERTAGNPLFAVQLVGDWVERGILEPGPRGLRLKQGAEAPLPDDLHDVWSERIDRLLIGRPPDDLRALTIAAVLGQDVEGEEWRAVLELAGVSPSPELVDTLIVQRLAKSGERGPEQSWSFVHGMLRESLERRSREDETWAAYNAACAEVLSESTGPGSKERLGRHLLQAGLAERAIAPLTEGALERIDAGEYRVAEVLLADRERALTDGEVDKSDARWGEGWVHRGRLSGLLGDPIAGEAMTRRAVEDARSRGWHRVAGMAYRELGRLARLKGEHRRAAVELELAQAYAKRIGDARLLAESCRDVAYLHLARGMLDLAEEYFGFARTEYEAIGEAIGVARCELGLGELAREAGRLDDAKAHVDRAMEEMERVGSRKGVSDCLNALGEVARLQGDLERAEAYYRDALAIRRALGVAQSIVCEMNLGLVLIERADWDAARETLEECLATVERQSNRKMMGSVHVCLLVTAIARIDLPAFDRHVRQAAGLLGETGFVDVDNARMAALAGDLAAQHGELERANEAYVLARHQWKALGRASEEEEIAFKMRTLALARR